MINDEYWQMCYNEPKAYVGEYHHFPAKSSGEGAKYLLNRVKYQRKGLKNGLMTEEQKVLFLTLCAERSGEHTGGRKKELIYQLYQCKTTD